MSSHGLSHIDPMLQSSTYAAAQPGGSEQPSNLPSSTTIRRRRQVTPGRSRFDEEGNYQPYLLSITRGGPLPSIPAGTTSLGHQETAPQATTPARSAQRRSPTLPKGSTPASAPQPETPLTVAPNPSRGSGTKESSGIQRKASKSSRARDPKPTSHETPTPRHSSRLQTESASSAQAQDPKPTPHETSTPRRSSRLQTESASFIQTQDARPTPSIESPTLRRSERRQRESSSGSGSNGGTKKRPKDGSGGRVRVWGEITDRRESEDREWRPVEW